MMPPAQLTSFLRLHSNPCGLDHLPRLVRDLVIATPQTGSLVFYAADSHRRLYFEFIEAAGVAHKANIVLLTERAEFAVLFSGRGGAGDIWESLLLPVTKIEYVALRCQHGRR